MMIPPVYGISGGFTLTIFMIDHTILNKSLVKLYGLMYNVTEKQEGV